MGGGEPSREFLKQDLVDEIHFGIMPSLLREGTPRFPSSFPQRDFSLIGKQDLFEGNDRA
jgi:dihydrofolate reductase